MGREGEQACLPCGCQGKRGGGEGQGCLCHSDKYPGWQMSDMRNSFQGHCLICLTFSTDSTRVEVVFSAVWCEGFSYPPKNRKHHLGVDLQWYIVGAVFSHTVASLYSGNQYLPKASGRLLGVESFFGRALPSSTPSRHNWHCRQLALWLYGNHVTCRKLSSHLSDLPAKGNTISCY